MIESTNVPLGRPTRFTNALMWERPKVFIRLWLILMIALTHVMPGQRAYVDCELAVAHALSSGWEAEGGDGGIALGVALGFGVTVNDWVT